MSKKQNVTQRKDSSSVVRITREGAREVSAFSIVTSATARKHLADIKDIPVTKPEREK